MPFRILVADDHAVVRAGLRTLLESRSGWQVCGEASNGREAVEKAATLKPDVVVMDIGMPLLNGIEATRQIRRVSPETEVLILTMHESDEMVEKVHEAGALGYVLKDVADSTLISAVEMLRRHKPFASARVAPTFARAGARPAKSPERRGRARGRLTQREREIVQLLAEGKSNKEVAGVLGISVRTAETHRANIMLKLNLHSVVELVHFAVRNNIIGQ